MGIRDSESLVRSRFLTDSHGNPTGGTTTLKAPGARTSDQATALHVNWQDGMVGEHGQNGAFVEDVLEAARQRLLFFNAGKYRCRENSLAITKIEEALQWLDWRTRQRVREGVENTYQVHP